MQGMRIYLESDKELRKYIKGLIQMEFNSLTKEELRENFDREYMSKFSLKIEKKFNDAANRVIDGILNRWDTRGMVEDRIKVVLNERIKKALGKYSLSCDVTLKMDKEENKVEEKNKEKDI